VELAVLSPVYFLLYCFALCTHTQIHTAAHAHSQILTHTQTITYAICACLALQSLAYIYLRMCASLELLCECVCGRKILSLRPLSPTPLNFPPPPACNCPDALIVFAYYTRPFMSYGNMKFIVSSSVLQPRSSLNLRASAFVLRPSVLQFFSLDRS